MEENKDRKGAFLIIISIATLIVAIIGATFAYFTATANSTENAVNFTAYEFNASVSVSKIAPSAAINNLIPIYADTDIVNVISLANNSANNGSCIDANGYTGCAIYKVTISNGSTKDALTLKGSLKSLNENAYENLKLSFLTESNGTYSASGTVIDIDEENEHVTNLYDALGNDVSVGVATDSQTPTTVDLYFVIYLDDTSTAQNSEMGQTFIGQLIFESTTGANGKLTAQISV